VENVDHDICPMPDLVRWPQFRHNLISESEQKIYDLVYVVDSHSVISRGLQELALDAKSIKSGSLNPTVTMVDPS